MAAVNSISDQPCASCRFGLSALDSKERVLRFRNTFGSIFHDMSRLNLTAVNSISDNPVQAADLGYPH